MINPAQRSARKHHCAIAWLAAGLAACFSQWAGAATPMPPTVITHGPFEIIAQGRNITTGGIFSTTGHRRTTHEVTDFAVKYRGKLVTVSKTPGSLANYREDMAPSHFWRVVRLTDAAQPTLLASTTSFWMITEESGQLVTRPFDASLAAYQWLDGDRGQPTMPVGFYIQKVDPVAGTELRGGRWLRLNTTVLDVRTLREYPIRPWIAYVPGVPFAGLQAGDTRAFAFSPGQTQYVTYAEGSEGEGSTVRYPALLVVDIPSGNAYGVKLARKAHHFNDMEDLTPEWLAHYFRWERDAKGVEQLLPRTGVQPLPWSGHFYQSSPDDIDYNLQPARPEIVPALARFITERMGATPAPDYLQPGQGHHGTTFQVPGCAGIINIYHDGKERVGVYAGATTPTGVKSPECAPMVRRIGEAFDAELKRGMHQALFVND